MKKIYTSNFARNGSNPNAIAISSIIPEWYNGKEMRELLAPKFDLVKKTKDGTYSKEKYKEEYLKLLNDRQIVPEELIELLPDGAILLCYEKPGGFCHRRILAEWIKEHMGFEIPEWKSEKEMAKDKIVDSILDF